MAVNTANYNLKKPYQEDFYNIEDHNGNMDIIDTQIKKIEVKLEEHVGDHEYQNATVNGTQIRLSRQSDTMRLFFYLSNDISGGNITISLDNGATSLPLKDIDGEQLTILDKGYWEVVDNTSFFTLRPRGGDERGFYGKYTGAQLTLIDKVKAGDYIYSNEDVQLELSDVTPVTIDHSTAVNACTKVDYMSEIYNNKYLPRLLRMSNGWFITLYNDYNTKKMTINVSKDNGFTWTKLSEVYTYTNSYSDIISCSMATVGTNIYILHVNADHIYLYTIDALTGVVTNTKSDIDTAQTKYSSNCFIIADRQNILHACWCSRNASYSTYFNIRYSKSIDGVNWEIPKQITTYNAYPDGDASNLYMFLLKNGNVGLIHLNYSSSIIFSNLNTSLSRIVIDSYPSTTRYSLCATALNNGKIFVSCFSKYSDYSYGTCMYITSNDNGATWGTGSYIEQFDYLSATTLQIVSDYNDNVYALYTHTNSDSGYYEGLRIKKFTSNSWELLKTIKIPSSVHDYAPCVCSNYKYFTSPVFVYRDNNAISNMLFTGIFTINPNVRLVPSINNADNESNMIAEGNGVLKTYGNSLKRYFGFISGKSKGWS